MLGGLIVPAVSPAAAATTASGVTGFGSAATYGSPPPGTDVVGMAATPDGRGYWLASEDGGVFAFGDAPFVGSAARLPLQAPVVAIAATPDGGGYWLAGADGAVMAFGDASFHGSAAALPLDSPVVGIAATPDGGGYWLAASDGAVFAFGDAPFLGAAPGGSPPVAAIAARDRGGYWLAATTGAVFSFGDAGFHGVAAGSAPVVGLAATPDGGGYWLLAADGVVSARGDALPDGSAFGGAAPAAAITGEGGGYWVAAGPPLDPLGPDVDRYLANRAGQVTAAVFDADDGRTSVFAPGMVEHTASIEKVGILATVLSQAAAAGRGPSPGEVGAASTMIENSDDNAATTLWNETGQGVDEAALDRALGLDQTTIDPGRRWGFTLTSALDQVSLLRAIAFPGPALSDGSRNLILDLMTHVEGDQAWGVSAGPAAGSAVALKNGWYPTGAVPGWQVNSIGVVSGHDRHYLIAVLTAGNPGFAYGVSTIEGVSRLVWRDAA